LQTGTILPSRAWEPACSRLRTCYHRYLRTIQNLTTNTDPLRTNSLDLSTFKLGRSGSYPTVPAITLPGKKRPGWTLARTKARVVPLGRTTRGLNTLKFTICDRMIAQWLVLRRKRREPPSIATSFAGRANEYGCQRMPTATKRRWMVNAASSGFARRRRHEVAERSNEWSAITSKAHDDFRRQ
jgi:hypothetical protein